MYKLSDVRGVTPVYLSFLICQIQSLRVLPHKFVSRIKQLNVCEALGKVIDT